MRQGWSAGRGKKKQHRLNYGPWLSSSESQALADNDRKSSVSELPVIIQPFLFLRLRVSVKTSTTSSPLDIAANSNRQVLTIT